MRHYLFGAFTAFFMMWTPVMTFFVPVKGQKTVSAIRIPTNHMERRNNISQQATVDDEELSTLRPTPTLEDHPLLVVCE